MVECCCCISQEKGFKVTGVFCCAVAVYSIASIILARGETTRLNRILGVCFLIVYGIPAYYWWLSRSHP